MSKLIRLERKRNRKYKTVYLEASEDPDLSWKAKGLHLYLMSRPPNWKLRYKDLINRGKDGKSAIGTGLKELQDHGYLVIEQDRDDEGKIIGSKWSLTESPSDMPIPDDKPHPDNPDTGNPETGNNPHVSVRSRTGVEENIDRSRTVTPMCVYPSDFESVWQIWLGLNRGVGKKKALKKWTATLKRNGTSKSELERAACNYAKLCNLTETSPQYIKHCATFFGPDEHWRDYTDDQIEDRLAEVGDSGKEAGKMRRIRDELAAAKAWAKGRE